MINRFEAGNQFRIDTARKQQLANVERTFDVFQSIFSKASSGKSFDFHTRRLVQTEGMNQQDTFSPLLTFFWRDPDFTRTVRVCLGEYGSFLDNQQNHHNALITIGIHKPSVDLLGDQLQIKRVREETVVEYHNRRFVPDDTEVIETLGRGIDRLCSWTMFHMNHNVVFQERLSLPSAA